MDKFPRRGIKRVVTTVAVVAAAAAAAGYYHTVSARSTTAPLIAQTSVTVGDVIEAVQSTGTLEPGQTVNVGSQVSGIVSNLFVDFNSLVKKGQVIATLDPALFQVQVDLQEANFARQQGEIANQQTQLENDQKTLERTTTMFEKGLVARDAFEDAQVQVKVRMSQLEAAKKTLQTSQANLDQAKLNLGYTTIRSPIDGVVVNRLVDIGQTVQSSLNVAQFFTLATDLRNLRLQATVDESEIAKVRPGMPVVFTVDSYGAESFRGTVNTVNLNAQSQSNVVTYPVWIDVPNPDFKLRPSMTANVRIIVATARQVARIPNAAYRFRPTADIYRALGIPQPPSTAARTAPSSVTPAAAAPAPARTARADATKVDELFAPFTKPSTRATVWTWNPDTKKLTDLTVQLGISDGQFSELLTDNLPAGQQLVTSVAVPQTSTQRNEQNILNGMSGRGGPGGFPGGGFPGGGRF